MRITVRYIGPDACVLAGTFILSGETRPVTAAHLAEAEAAHPGMFVVEEGTWPAVPIALPVAQVPPVPIEVQEAAVAPPIEPDAQARIEVQEAPIDVAPPAPAPARPPAVRRGRH